jgi:hypothetical protein
LRTAGRWRVEGGWWWRGGFFAPGGFIPPERKFCPSGAGEREMVRNDPRGLAPRVKKFWEKDGWLVFFPELSVRRGKPAGAVSRTSAPAGQARRGRLANNVKSVLMGLISTVPFLPCHAANSDFLFNTAAGPAAPPYLSCIPEFPIAIPIRAIRSSHLTAFSLNSFSLFSHGLATQ